MYKIVKNILSLLTLLFSFQLSYAQLIIKNSGFEIVDSSGTFPKFWDGPLPGFALIRERDQNHGYVVKMQKTTGETGGDIFFQRINYPHSNHGQKYLLSGNIKTENLGKYYGAAGFMFSAFDKDSIKLIFPEFEIHSVKNTIDWKKIRYEVYIPSATKYIEVGGYLIDGEKAWYNNIQLQRIKVLDLKKSPEAQKYLDDAIKIITKNSLFKDSLNLIKLTEKAKGMSIYAQSNKDCYPAIKWYINQIHNYDHHSFFQTPEQAKFLNAMEEGKKDMPSGKLLENNIGYIKIPTFLHVNKEIEHIFADSCQNIIKSIDRCDIKGWVVDIRDNLGGNCWPMIAGIGPILGEGIATYAIHPDKKKDSSGYRNGRAYENADTIIRLLHPYNLCHQNPFVAVLTNQKTASSGEAVALSFKNRPRAKSFGEATMGLTTGNEMYKLSDGALLFVAIVKGVDRLGNVYGGKILPDMFIMNDKNSTEDKVLNEAIKWLKEQKMN